MAFLTGLAIAASAIGSLAGVAGSVMSAQAQSKAERIRKRQMDLDTIRRRREILRQGIFARSQALATAVSQGADKGSGLQGGYAGISGAVGRQTLAESQNYQLGNQMFDANRQNAQGQIVSNIGGGLQSLGSSILSNYGTFERIGWVG